MDSREFVKLAKHETVDNTIKVLIDHLRTPRRPRPAAVEKVPGIVADSLREWFNEGAIRQQRQAAWFATLGEDGQRTLFGLLEECAELAASSFFALIDGVGGEFEGVFEIVAVFGGNRTVLNPQNTEMLHDLFSDVCEEERATDPQ